MVAQCVDGAEDDGNAVVAIVADVGIICVAAFLCLGENRDTSRINL